MISKPPKKAFSIEKRYASIQATPASKYFNKWLRGLSANTSVNTYSPSTTFAAGEVQSEYSSVAILIKSFSDIDSELYVDPEGVKEAEQFLYKLMSVNVAAPKVFPLAEESVIFVWERKNGKEYAFFAGDVISLTHVPLAGPEWQMKLDMNKPTSLVEFAAYLGN